MDEEIDDDLLENDVKMEDSKAEAGEVTEAAPAAAPAPAPAAPRHYGGGASSTTGRSLWFSGLTDGVADASLESMLAKGFLEKLALMTEPCREEAAWRTGATLSQQRAFGPTLQQRMDQANSQGRIAMVSAQCDEVKGMMRDNIELLLARGDKLDELEEKAGALATISKQFHKGARHAKRAALWSNAKFGLAVGTAVTVGVAVIATPAIVAAAV